MGRKHGWAGLALALLFAACRQGPTPGTKVEIQLVGLLGEPGLGIVAYQAGEGAWQALGPVLGHAVFELPAGEHRYGVAVVCDRRLEPTAQFTRGRVFLYQLTTEDTTRAVFSCPGIGDRHDGTLSVYVDARNPDADRVFLYHAFLERYWTGPQHGAYLKTPAGRGLSALAVAFKNGYGFSFKNAVAIARRRFDLDPDGLAYVRMEMGPNDKVDLINGKNAGRVVGFSPPGGRGGYRVGYFSPGGLSLWWNAARWDYESLGWGDEQGGPFIRIPGAVEGEVYVLKTTGGGRTSRYDFIPAPGADELVPGPLPEPWSHALEVEIAPLPTVALNYGDEAIGYRLFYYSENSRGTWTLFVSRRWLGEQERYAFPDLTALPGFEALKPVNDVVAYLFVDAIFSDAPLGDWLSSETWMPDLNLPVLGGEGIAFATASEIFQVGP